jgi:hypothetical protein
MKIKQILREVSSGGMIGFINGIFGGGGGMVAVPLLQSKLGYSQKEAHATAIAIIAPVCAISAIIYMVSGYSHSNIVIPTAIGSTLGGLAGVQLLDKLPDIVIKIIFVTTMTAAGVRMIIG